MFDIGGLVGVLRDLHVDERAIQDVLRALNVSSVEFEDDSFKAGARIPTSAFGGSEAGHDLGFHHGKAQQVIADTIDGVTKDLEAFRDGVRQAIRLVDEADQSSADDLNRKRQIAEGFANVWKYSQGDAANRESRNRNLGTGYGEDD